MRRPVHCYQYVRSQHYGGADHVIRKYHRAVCSASAHFSPVGRKTGHLLSLDHACLGKDFPQKQDPLSACACYDDPGFQSMILSKIVFYDP